MGTAESIAVVVLIGLSVDYVVHLGIHYLQSGKETRKEKMDEACVELGRSVVSAAITTLGSGVFLFFASIIIL